MTPRANVPKAFVDLTATPTVKRTPPQTALKFPHLDTDYNHEKSSISGPHDTTPHPTLLLLSIAGGAYNADSARARRGLPIV